MRRVENHLSVGSGRRMKITGAVWKEYTNPTSIHRANIKDNWSSIINKDLRRFRSKTLRADDPNSPCLWDHLRKRPNIRLKVYKLGYQSNGGRKKDIEFDLPCCRSQVLEFLTRQYPWQTLPWTSLNDIVLHPASIRRCIKHWEEGLFEWASLNDSRRRIAYIRRYKTSSGSGN